MKKLIFVFVGLFLSVLSFAQDVATDNVPQAVVNSFKKSYPKATEVEWELEAGLYNAEFNLGTVDHEVWLDKNGTIVKHKKEILTKDLPTTVTNTVKQQFKGYRIDDADTYEVDNHVFYKIELKKQQFEQTIVLDALGKITDRIL